MTTTRVHKSEPHDEYVGRSRAGDSMGGVPVGHKGWLGNPYKVSDYGREQCIELFERDLGWIIEAKPLFKAKLVSMYGKTIACHCFDHQDCHGDVIVEKINELYWDSL